MAKKVTEQWYIVLSALREIAHDGCKDIQLLGASTTCLDRGHLHLACNSCIARAAIAKIGEK